MTDRGSNDHQRGAGACGLARDGAYLDGFDLDSHFLKPRDGFFDFLACAIDFEGYQTDLIRHAGLPHIGDDFEVLSQLPENWARDETGGKHEPESSLLHESTLPPFSAEGQADSTLEQFK